jgi:hypothetical protein
VASQIAGSPFRRAVRKSEAINDLLTRYHMAPDAVTLCMISPVTNRRGRLIDTYGLAFLPILSPKHCSYGHKSGFSNALENFQAVQSVVHLPKGTCWLSG